MSILIRRWVFLAGAIFVLIMGFWIWRQNELNLSFRESFQAKADLLESCILTNKVREELGSQDQYTVFISICDGAKRASVRSGTGNTLEAAWTLARKAAATLNVEPLWMKADVAASSTLLSAAELKQALLASRRNYYRFGLAWEGAALLEEELNGAEIYDYKEGNVDLYALNQYLRYDGRPAVKGLPENYTSFQCLAWLCDEDNTVHPLISRGLDYGRRAVLLDKDCASRMISTAAEFLLRQMKWNGSFIYGLSPCFDDELSSYNILRHAGTVWSLCLYYRMNPSPELKARIERGLKYLFFQVIYKDKGTAYIWEDKSDEIKLGGCGLAILALTEYMDVMGSDQYKDICCALGNGILHMMDDHGAYVHVLNRDFSLKETYRTVYYDGEATFALTRLYRLTNEQRWLDAVCRAVDHFIAENYIRYKDHWIAYAMNELTRYVNNNDYLAFALKNAQNNLQSLAGQDTTSHIYLELLMATFEVYDRIASSGIKIKGFDLDSFLKAIHIRADRQLNGYFFPEYAMYMANPQRILHTFMVRQDGYRVRIDDVQHNIGGYYHYWRNYDKLVEYGMPVQ